jgi:hypothetical protein
MRHNAHEVRAKGMMEIEHDKKITNVNRDKRVI